MLHICCAHGAAELVDLCELAAQNILPQRQCWVLENTDSSFVPACSSALWQLPALSTTF